MEGLVVGDNVATVGSTEGCLDMVSDGTLLKVIEGLSDFASSAAKGKEYTRNVGAIDLGSVGAIVEGILDG